MYYEARYYDPALGRFISADTIVPEPGNPQALNRYSYVYNNPLRYTDPTGQWPLISIPDMIREILSHPYVKPLWQDPPVGAAVLYSLYRQAKAATRGGYVPEALVHWSQVKLLWDLSSPTAVQATSACVCVSTGQATWHWRPDRQSSRRPRHVTPLGRRSTGCVLHPLSPENKQGETPKRKRIVSKVALLRDRPRRPTPGLRANRPAHVGPWTKVATYAAATQTGSYQPADTQVEV